ncbi:polyphosphate kinase [Thalassotalea sp. HSM 43]|uniref:polyphosphate kinase 2 family protein n=1 Tax=Thalassotalea sp. HSM 43 TaxID=2552945 RepID=UPI0010805C29|nr:PPK2 family polyphosphate kinase [Thalassotalea sp. HSM 43]QBY05158.1 polyphosphate kinase [Thalassotalea sp. HSM 43]
MHKPSPIQLIDNPACLEDVDLNNSFEDGKKQYQKTLAKLQKQLLIVQQAYFHQGHRAILVFEGWDAAGKGGAIRRVTEKLDPRGFRVYPIAAPNQEEQSKHYLFRFQKRLPPAGRIGIFDRSYYGRVLVERVEGFASKKQWQRAYQEINEFERQLSDDGARIIKIFMHISEDEQLKRFEERLQNPYKRWKLTEEDIRNREKWPDYHQAINDMFRQTSTNHSQWQVISGNHKWSARISVLKYLVDTLSAGVDISPPPVDDNIVALAKQQLGINPQEID